MTTITTTTENTIVNVKLNAATTPISSTTSLGITNTATTTNTVAANTTFIVVLGYRFDYYKCQ